MLKKCYFRFKLIIGSIAYKSLKEYYGIKIMILNDDLFVSINLNLIFIIQINWIQFVKILY